MFAHCLLKLNKLLSFILLLAFISILLNDYSYSFQSIKKTRYADFKTTGALKDNYLELYSKTKTINFDIDFTTTKDRFNKNIYKLNFFICTKYEWELTYKISQKSIKRESFISGFNLKSEAHNIINKLESKQTAANIINLLDILLRLSFSILEFTSAIINKTGIFLTQNLRLDEKLYPEIQKTQSTLFSA